MLTKINSAVVGIYKIVSPSGKIYIGQSVDIEKRWKEHRYSLKSKETTKLKSSFQSHGFENHTFEVLEECSVEFLNERERYYQDQFDVLGPNGLNLVLTKTGDKKFIMSETLKENLRRINLGQKRSIEARESMSKAQKLYNSTLTDEQKEIRNKKNSDGQKKVIRTKEQSIQSTIGLKKYWKNKIENQTEEEKQLLSKEMSERRSKGKGAVKKVINTETKEIFDSILLASDTTIYSMNVLSNMLRGVTKNKTNFKYHIE